MATKKAIKKVNFSKETLCFYPVVETKVVCKIAFPAKLGISITKEDVYTKIYGNPEIVKFVCDNLNKYASELECHISHYTDKVALFKNEGFRVSVLKDVFNGAKFFRLIVVTEEIKKVHAAFVDEDIDCPFCGNYPVEELDGNLIDIDMY